MLPIEEILFAPVEEKREATPDEVPQIEDELAPTGGQEADNPETEIYPEKPRDENSDPLPKTDLTEEEIAQLILDEEEVLNEKGVLGVNFKKIRPRAPLLKESQVFKELQQEAEAEPESVQELKRQSTFLKKPDRAIPKPRNKSESEESKQEPEPEPYRVVIKKQPRKPITQLLLQKGLIDPSRVNKTAEPSAGDSEVNEPTARQDYNPESVAPSECPGDGETIVESAITDSRSSAPGTCSFARCVETFVAPPEANSAIETMPSIDEQQQQQQQEPQQQQHQQEPLDEDAEERAGERAPRTYVSTVTIVPSEPEPAATRDEFAPVPGLLAARPAKRQRLCRRGRYAKRCLSRALESLKAPARDKPRLLRRGRYFERIVQSLAGGSPREAKCKAASEQDSLLNVLMLASLAYSLRDTYDTEILHRGSSRRNSRRMSTCRRESKSVDPYESGFLALKARRDSMDGLASFQSRCAEGRRRLSVMGTMVADKVSSAMRTDLARGLAYAMVPCASALAFYMFNYMKRYNSGHE